MRFGVTIRYKGYDLYKREKLQEILEIVDAINPFLEYPLNRYTTMDRNNLKKKNNKLFRLDDKDAKEILIKECAARKYDIVTFYNGNLDDQPRTLFNVYIDKSDEFDHPLQRLELDVENISAVSERVVTILSSQIPILLNYWYGYVVVSDADYSDFHSQVSWYPIKKWDSLKKFQKTEGEKELEFYQKNANNLNTYIAKAYWGNFLNATHVERLGGIEQIKKTAPVYQVENFPNGSAYIQLTKSPIEFREKNFKKKLISLDAYFRPIILPGRPEVLW